ncbi:hypothetical protein CBP36_05485 [Acidovorax carolinensis]|uniref:Uncharacterized protein n=1 Tax=Acidovorax carolinensis TaxID=553814 RepID=A0A240UBH1_9BURK|nr:hypothetical protein [Acidovorax carolinensis]ART55743.1 hypothetical protein CBP35_13445 [Acidovorax carolinensis]ART58389.1 hypothetical protein CBP36_05485 [Acidovorax carolinensis]
MKVLKPIALTDAMIVSNSIPPDTRPAWVSGANYAQGAECVYQHRAYERLGAGAGVKTPDIDVDYWLDLGPTNDRAMFDNVIGTVSHGDSPLTLVLQPGGVGGVGFVEVSGREIEVTLTDRPGPGATQVYHRKIDLDGTPIFSVYDWFFAEYEPLRDVVLTDLPEHWRSGELTIKVTAISGQASIGVCKPCRVLDVGGTRWGARVSILDFGEKTRDKWGNYSYRPGE